MTFGDRTSGTMKIRNGKEIRDHTIILKTNFKNLIRKMTKFVMTLKKGCFGGDINLRMTREGCAINIINVLPLHWRHPSAKILHKK